MTVMSMPLRVLEALTPYVTYVCYLTPASPFVLPPETGVDVLTKREGTTLPRFLDSASS